MTNMITNPISKIIFIMGVSGSGKTTIGQLLSKRSGLPFFDGDDFHPAENIEKMKSGQPLNDDDRQGWLHAINRSAVAAAGKGGAIFACSALKASYRNLLSQDIEGQIIWVFLDGDYELIRKRLEQRTAHFMPPGLLKSQFEALERPENALIVDLQSGPEAIVDKLIQEIKMP